MRKKKGGGGGAETELHCSRDRLFPKGPVGGACAVRVLCARLQQAGCLCVSLRGGGGEAGGAWPALSNSDWAFVGRWAGVRAEPPITTLGLELRLFVAAPPPPNHSPRSSRALLSSSRHRLSSLALLAPSLPAEPLSSQHYDRRLRPTAGAACPGRPPCAPWLFRPRLLRRLPDGDHGSAAFIPDSGPPGTAPHPLSPSVLSGRRSLSDLSTSRSSTSAQLQPRLGGDHSSGRAKEAAKEEGEGQPGGAAA